MQRQQIEIFIYNYFYIHQCKVFRGEDNTLLNIKCLRNYTIYCLCYNHNRQIRIDRFY